MSEFIITIDGPAGSGKSTIAKMIASKFDAAFLDTGAMYRAATLAAMMDGTDLSDQNRIIEIIDNAVFDFKSSSNGMAVQIDGADVTSKIRDPKVTANTRYVAVIPAARERLVDMQRKFAKKYKKIVTEGRDQGTIVFPNANVKFYLTADINERARRRHIELKANGITPSEDEIRKSIIQRDQSDESRLVGPLKPADDAIIIDTTALGIQEVVEKLANYIIQRCPNKK